MDQTVLLVVLFIVAYLLGSIPTAYLVGLLRGIDIFKVGSGNMGATNIVRATGKMGWGALVWFFDSAKSVIAVLIGQRVMPDSLALATVVTSIGVMVGHNWSIFVMIITGKLRGGKGAAAAFGTLLTVVPVQVIAGMLALFLVILARTRFVSLGVLMMFGLAVVWIAVLILQQLIQVEYIVYILAVYALLLLRFRENIERLLAGTERRIGESSGL
ncbi:MAG: glycerol-3-phosphate acyltransferase [Chloroflexota bacterium]|nr:glycerol-3-phosphate acyltransferase [Chloroflexota bacterium]